MKRISSPIESLLDTADDGKLGETTDYLIIGSGYGGAVAAMRLSETEKGLDPKSVVVLERGKEYLPGDFPYDVEDLPAHIRLAQTSGETGGGYADALFNLHVGDTVPVSSDAASGTSGAKTAAVDILVGSGLGGTSLINANVAEEPSDAVFQQPEWPQALRGHKKPLAAAFKAVRQQLNLTQRTTADGKAFGKYTALERIAQAAGAEARPAQIAVNALEGANPQGVIQPACSNCGNCITGCNTGAKNSLDRNLLRSAKSNGVQFYTGATVLYIEATGDSDRRWRVWIRPTVKIPRPESATSPDAEDAFVERHGQLYCLEARNVILAAGTLGSTEILQRSRARTALSLSSMLGNRFSSNGDGIAFSYGQNRPVNAVAEPEQCAPSKQKQVGPTITGIVQTRGLTIEDASVPAAMARVFAELTTTGAMLQRLNKLALPDHIRWSRQDPLAASSAVAEHCQALLIMGDDGATGRLRFSEEEDSISVEAPGGSQSQSLVDADELLSGMDRSGGLDGGQYVPNPLWQLMPADAGDVLAGNMPPSRALTVHPLGGCAMGDTVETGVVNHAGQVFDASGELHEGLYVLDGSIVPRALGVNPFLTIAALAWRACDCLLAGMKTTRQKVSPPYVSLGCEPPRHRTARTPTRFGIEEQMLGELAKLPDYLVDACKKKGLDANRLLQRDGLVVGVTAEQKNAEQWLNNPGAQPLHATMTLHVNPVRPEDVEDFQPEGVRLQRLKDNSYKICELDGEFTIFAEDDHSLLSDVCGGLIAVFTYLRRRGFSNIPKAKKPGGLVSKFIEQARSLWGFCKIGALQSRRRRIRYDFETADRKLQFAGEKVLGYSVCLPRLWPALMNLDARLRQDNGLTFKTRLRVNSEQLISPGLIAVRESAHLPQSLLFAGGLTGFFARSVFATNFWELGGADVPDAPRKQRTLPRPLKTASGNIEPELETRNVPLRRGADNQPEGQVPLLLTRYRNPGKPPVLMLHGLAQGSQIFWTDSIEHNLANHFFDEGFDVWLLDYRLSNHILPHMADQDWSIDEIAQFDIPMALEAVCEKTGSEKTAVVAHCVGACALAMATLSDKDVGRRVSAAVTNAIHPWVIASSGNKFRAKLGGMYREWVPQELLDPIPDESDSAVQNVMDRVGFGLARLSEAKEDNHQHYGDDAECNSICDRMTFLYGRMWNHKNLARATHNAFQDMLGPAPIGVYQHLYHFTHEQRITDKQGENIYLTRERIRANWRFPILFVHGGDSRVFNPHAARRSAYRLTQQLSGLKGRIQPDVDHKIYPGYGHMDVIFGKEAHIECFKDYVTFIKTGKKISGNVARDWVADSAGQFLTGPILRAAWREDKKIRLRFWGELRRSQANAPGALNVSGARLVTNQEIECHSGASNIAPQFRLLDVEVDADAEKIELGIAAQSQTAAHSKSISAPDGHRLSYESHAWFQQLRLHPEGSEEQASSQYKQEMSFLLGSCRYPGSLVDNALCDQVFEAMLEHTQGKNSVHLAFFTGDQIYADATDQVLEVKSPKTRYGDRYRTAFGKTVSPNFARLVTQVPTHFSLDDHELTDNWSGYLKAPTNAPSGTVDYALNAATRFMGGGRAQAPIGKAAATGCKPLRHPFHYALHTGKESQFPVYIADTRAQRKPRTSGGVKRFSLMETDQIKAIEEWLKNANSPANRGKPKFIVSGSIVAPLSQFYCDNKDTWRQQDGWAGYPATLEYLLSVIAQEGIPNVVFVGGDAHLSAVSELRVTTPEGKSTKLWQVVGSGLYAPLPFANSAVEHFVWEEEHSLPVHTEKLRSISCTNTFLSDAYSQFVRVNANRQEVWVGCFDAQGEELRSHRFSLTEAD